jgi:hypothetical protein
MGGKPWQLKPIENVQSGTLSSRYFKKSEAGGKSQEWRTYKRGYTRHREGKWFAHGLPIYQLWWEFLVRAYQAEGIVVDRSRYKNWGSSEGYLNVDVWSSKSRKDGFWKFWRGYGSDLFAEDDDRGVAVVVPDNKFEMSEGNFYLEIPSGTPANELLGAVKRIVKDNAAKKKNQHISTAVEQISAKEIRSDSYRRWLKMWDMKQKGDYSVEEIDMIHGRGGPQSYEFDNYKTTYRNLWKAKKIVANVAEGEFPGKVV